MQRSCKTCRQRRRACDKARPTCGSCKKTGLLCEGYEDQNQVFVNFNSKNVSSRKKNVLSDAIQRHQKQTVSKSSPISTEQTEHRVILLSNDDVRTRSLRVLDMTTLDFQDHVSTLWAYFEQNHTKTNCGWAPALTPLKLQNRALDLALMSIASLRLSQHKKDPSMKVLSHTSYANSLQIFRKLCQNPGKGSDLLPVITLVYSLIEGTQEAPVAIFTPGLISFNSHLRGCIHFAKQCGPGLFKDGGLHQAFKKIRELALLESLTVSEASFLAEDDWMKGPWESTAKTRRDKLQDIMARLTVLASKKAATLQAIPSPPYSSENSPKSTTGEDRLAEIEKQERALSEWASEWHSSVAATPSSPDVPLDIFYTNLAPDQIYLEVELWSNQLLVHLAHLQATNPDFGKEAGPAEVRRRAEAAALARRTRNALAMPIFGGGRKDNGCLIEGQCRSLFPAWVTMEHGKIDPRPWSPDSLHGTTGLGDGWTYPVEDFSNPQHLLGWWAMGSPPLSMGTETEA